MFDTIIFILFAIVMLLIIAFLYYRDKSIFAKMEAYEMAIDDLHSRVHKLEAGGLNADTSIKNYKEIFEKIEDNLENRLNEIGEPLLRTIRAVKSIENRLNKLETKIDNKINELHQTSKTQQSITDTNRYEERVISLYKEGKSIEEISKLTRVGVGEIELMIKLANLKKDR